VYRHVGLAAGAAGRVNTSEAVLRAFPGRFGRVSRAASRAPVDKIKKRVV
jgi:hypothetical protein